MPPEINFKEAIQQTKALAKQYAGLAKLAETLTLIDGQEERLAQLERRRIELESKVIARNTELEQTLRETSAEIDASRARLAEVVAEEEAAERALAKTLKDTAHAAEVWSAKEREFEAAFTSRNKAREDELAALTERMAHEQDETLAGLKREISEARDEHKRITDEHANFKRKVLG